MPRDRATFSLWRLHESVRPYMQSEELAAMARRGELSALDRIRRGSGAWREVGDLASLQPAVDSMLRLSEVHDVLEALRSSESASIELGLAKAKALGLFGMPWLAAVLLETVLRLCDDDDVPTILVILDSMGSWPGMLGNVGRALYDVQASQSCHALGPVDIIDRLASGACDARLCFDVARRMVGDPGIAGALTQRLWDEPGPHDRDAGWIRSVLRTADPMVLMRALANHGGRAGAQSVFLEAWMLDRAAGCLPSGDSWGGNSSGSTSCCRTHLCIDGGGSALSAAALSTLVQWFEPAWWDSLVVRNVFGGAAALLQVSHDGIVRANELRLEESEEFEEDDPDEGMKAGESRLLTPTSHVLRIELAACRFTPAEIDGLRAAMPSTGYCTTMEVRDCPGLPDAVACWLASHAFDPFAKGETPEEWELESRSGILTIENVDRALSFEAVRGSPLFELSLSGVPMGRLPDSVMLGTSFPRLQRIRLRNCGLTSLRWGRSPDPVIGPVTLRKVDLSDNRISEVSFEFDELPKVESIVLSDNAIQSVNVLGNLDMAKSLDLARNPLRHPPDINWQEDYDLSGTLASELPKLANDSPDLRSLTLPSTLRVLPARIAELGSLKSLALEDARLESIPAELFTLFDLESVTGLWGGIEIVGTVSDEASEPDGDEGEEGPDDDGGGDSFGEPDEAADGDPAEADEADEEPAALDVLRDRVLALRVSMHGMAPPADDDATADPGGTIPSSRWIEVMMEAAGHVSLPRWLARLDVISMWLSSFGGSSLPDWLAALPELRGLHLSGSRLEALPARLLSSRIMETIACDSPFLHELPGCRTDGWGTRLETLDLMGSGVTSLPESIATASGLRHVLLDRSRVRTLPAGILALPLERLSIIECPVEALPAGKSGLARLQSFDADRSRLAALPEWIGGCRSLLTVNLRGAPLRTVPASILACTELVELVISRDAPLDDASRAVLERLGKGRVRYCSNDE
ncbi:MAG: hypothetical protein RLZ94_934 [Actinomycetota bacterium]